MTDTFRSDRGLLVLSGLSVCGLALASWDEFVVAGIWGAMGLSLVYLAGGVPIAVNAVKSLWHDHTIDIDFLMILAAIAAAAVGATLEGAVLLTLFSISNTLEHRAMARARRAVEALMELRPDTALTLLPSGATVEIAVGDLRPGNVVLLRPGDRVPADGVVLEGKGSMDEATITGESMPVEKNPGSQVFEATVNLNSVLTITISHAISESTVARMIALVTEAQATRAPSERFSEWFGQKYTIAVIVGSVAAFALLLFLGWTFDNALYRAATILVAASPCAVVISVPAAILSALGAAARGGVLFKGGSALETLAEVDIFAFDKTGTLTTGKAEVTRLATLISEREFLSLISGLEARSEHPSAAAIRNYAALKEVVPVEVEDVLNLPSEGITGKVGKDRLWAGNLRIVDRMGASVLDPGIVSMAEASQSIVYFGRNNLLLGAVSVADQPRKSSAAGLDALRRDGIRRITMLTGDRRAVAERIGAELGMNPEDIYAELLPNDKVQQIAEMSRHGRVAFVGDGVNDAAALARADIGIAMGAAGSDVALQAADVALLSDDMERLAAARRIARRTRYVIRQNLLFAVGAMVVLVLSTLFFALPMPLAVLGHEGGTVLVVLNGLRLLADPIRKVKQR